VLGRPDGVDHRAEVRRMAKDLEVSVLDLTGHSYPLSEQIELARTFTEAGIRNWVPDQTFNWWPDGLLDPDLAPVVEQGWPKHTFWDRYVQIAWVAALVPGSTWAVSPDVVRRGPDTMAQMAMTLHEFTGGNVLLCLTAGEVKQLAPFGYEEEKPFTRVDEMIQVLEQLWTSDVPFDFDGQTVHLKNAYMGLRSSDGTLPPITTIGLSPRLRRIAARHGAYVPVAGTAEVVQEQMAEARAEAERVGRDPAELKFWSHGVTDPAAAAQSTATFHGSFTAETAEDEAIIRSSPLAKWAAVGGWIPVNREKSPFGADYHYASDMVPTEWDRDRVFAVLDKVPDDDVHYTINGFDDIVRRFVRTAEAGVDMVRVTDRSAEIVPGMRHRLTDLYVRATKAAREQLAAS
jgi:alkanesulfonate monooxygenase SsuD/methylene tetrahydromethanopterin reductase-like flavin-dependent oxidoreductase (luciferase family)